MKKQINNLTKILNKIVILIAILFSFEITAKIPIPTVFYLKNGLKISVFCNKILKTCYTYMVVNVGSSDDRSDMIGLSHMLEHLLFKGSKNYPKNKASDLIKQNGGYENAYTTDDFTVYSVYLPYDQLKLALSIQKDRLFYASFSEQDFLSEQKIVLEERLMRIENSIYKDFIEVYKRASFLTTDYGVPTIGYEFHIKNYKYNALKKHYSNYYVPNNMHLVIVSPHEVQDMANIIKDLFEDIESKKISQKINKTEVVKKNVTNHIFGNEKRIKNALAVIDYNITNKYSKNELFILSLFITNVLSGSLNNVILCDLIKTRQLALDIGFSISYNHNKNAKFEIFYTSLKNEDFDKIRPQIYYHLKNIIKNGINENDFQNAKTKLVNSLAFVADGYNLSQYIDLYCQNLIDIDFFKKAQKDINNFKREDLEKFLNNVLKNQPDIVLNIFPQNFMPKNLDYSIN